MSVILRTGVNKNKDVKIDYQGCKKKKIKKIEEEEHILSYIKSGTDGSRNQIYWFESDKKGRVYVIANKELFNLGFYKYNYKTRDIKVIGKVNKNNKLKIIKIL